MTIVKYLNRGVKHRPPPLEIATALRGKLKTVAAGAGKSIGCLVQNADSITGVNLR